MKFNVTGIELELRRNYKHTYVIYVFSTEQAHDWYQNVGFIRQWRAEYGDTWLFDLQRQQREKVRNFHEVVESFL